VFLSISTSATKNISYLRTKSKEIVSINLKLVLHLKLLALERRVNSVC
jgi:hypothetical protein